MVRTDDYWTARLVNRNDHAIYRKGRRVYPHSVRVRDFHYFAAKDWCHEQFGAAGLVELRLSEHQLYLHDRKWWARFVEKTFYFRYAGDAVAFKLKFGS